MNRGLWDRETVAQLLAAALLPVAVIWFWLEGAQAASRITFTLALMGGWQIVFLIARAQPPSLSMVVSGLAISVLAPEELGLLQLGIGIFFGYVFGELVFGGWGRNILNPATLVLAFLGFGFPAYDWPQPLVPVVWAAIPAVIIGIALGVMPVGVLLGAAVVGVAGAYIGDLSSIGVQAAGLVLVLLICDPVSSASTRLGGWMNGAFYACIVVLFDVFWAGAAPVQIAVSAALLTALVAPLLDEAAIAIWVAQRRKRHGRT